MIVVVFLEAAAAPGAVWLLIQRGDEDQRDARCTYETNYSARVPRPSGLALGKEPEADEDVGEHNEQYKESGRLIVRQECSYPAPAGGGLTPAVFVVAIGIVLALGGYLLARGTALEERRSKKARLVPLMHDPQIGRVRVVNVGDSHGMLIGVGVVPGGESGVGSNWQKLTRVSRLVAVDEEDVFDYPLRLSRIAPGGLFTVLLRYEDVYGRTWHAWRTWRKMASGKLVARADGEQRGRRDDAG
ncbi:MAG TPA: hypothetical protein VF614_14260 [Chthoniobacteraceae bacterium]